MYSDAGSYLRVDWDAPDEHPGGVIFYNVYYREKGESQFTKVRQKAKVSF